MIDNLNVEDFIAYTMRALVLFRDDHKKNEDPECEPSRMDLIQWEDEFRDFCDRNWDQNVFS